MNPRLHDCRLKTPEINSYARPVPKPSKKIIFCFQADRQVVEAKKIRVWNWWKPGPGELPEGLLKDFFEQIGDPGSGIISDSGLFLCQTDK